MARKAAGQATRLAHSTGWVNCQSRRRITSPDEAPMALRTPISLVRRSVTKAARANRPRHAMTIARLAQIPSATPWVITSR